jgi:hypothetical protein
MRETIVWILFCLLLAPAAFGGGYIVRDRETDKMLLDKISDLRDRVSGLEWDYKWDHKK